MRILLVTNKCPPDFDGGYELRAFQLANALRARGHELDVVTSAYRSTYEGERQDPPWVHRIFRYASPSKLSGLARAIDRITQFVKGTRVAAENAPALERFLNGREYDIAYCFAFARIGFATSQVLTRKGIPILWHAGDAHLVQRFVDWPRKIPGYDLAMRIFAGEWWTQEKSIDLENIAVVSEFLKEKFSGRGLPVKRLRVISRGIEFPLATGDDQPRDEPPTFFTASRLDPQKGIHHVITACGLLHRKHPQLRWRLHVAGQPMTPGYLSELQAMAAAGGIADHVEFLGRLPHGEVLERMRRATAFIFASVYGEPFSSTIIESLACGTPLLGSDDGSILEVVTAGEHALIHRRNSPEELAANLERILLEPGLPQSLRTAGLRRITERYTMDRILEQTEAVLGEIVTARRSAAASPEGRLAASSAA